MLSMSEVPLAAAGLLTATACLPMPQGLWLAGMIGLCMFGLLYNFCPIIFKAMGAKPEVSFGSRGRAWVGPYEAGG